MYHRAITDEELASLDLAKFNGGKNPHGDSSIYTKISTVHRRNKILQLGLVNNGKVLDLLCGFGAWLIFLAEVNDEVWGLDFNEGAIRIAKGLCDHFGFEKTSLHAGDVSEIAKFPSGYFDSVLIWNALIGVDRGSTLDQVHRLLKPGGRLVVGAANSTGRLMEKLVNNLNPDRPSDMAECRQAVDGLLRGPFYEGRPNFFTRTTAETVLQRHGFELLEIKPEGSMVWGVFPQHVNVIARRPMT